LGVIRFRLLTRWLRFGRRALWRRRFAGLALSIGRLSVGRLRVGRFALGRLALGRFTLFRIPFVRFSLSGFLVARLLIARFLVTGLFAVIRIGVFVAWLAFILRLLVAVRPLLRIAFAALLRFAGAIFRFGILA